MKMSNISKYKTCVKRDFFLTVGTSIIGHTGLKKIFLESCFLSSQTATLPNPFHKCMKLKISVSLHEHYKVLFKIP